MRKNSLLFILGILVLVAVMAYGAFVFFQVRSAEDTLAKNKTAIEQLEAQVLKLENERVLEAVSAKKTADVVETEAVIWSEIIKKIRDTVPEDDGELIAEITSYSGARDRLTFAVKTAAGRDEPYFDVADFIEAFNESEYFSDSFVPSISSGLNDRGEEILTFSMTTNYVESAVDVLLR